MKEQAVPILNFLLRKFSTDRVRISRCTQIFIKSLFVDMADDDSELHYSITYLFNEKEYAVEGDILDPLEVANLRKSLCNFLYVGFWVKKRDTKNFKTFSLTQLALDYEPPLIYRIIYTCKGDDKKYTYTISDESSVDKSLSSPLNIEFSEELYTFTL